ncbi:MAG: hypothetical protein ACLR23_28695 [Clostridia bacterium]
MGQCRIDTADSSEIFHENEFIFLDENVQHSLNVKNGRCKIFNLEFECSRSATSLSITKLCQADETFRQFLTKPRPYVSGTDSSSLGSAMRDCVAELTQHGDTTYLFTLLFQRVLLELARCIQHNIPSKSMGYINCAESFIQAHFQEELRAEDIAKAAGIHPSYLQSFVPPALWMRHHDPCQSPPTGNGPPSPPKYGPRIEAIAEEVGYNSRQHFGSAFKSFSRKPPGIPETIWRPTLNRRRRSVGEKLGLPWRAAQLSLLQYLFYT